MKVFSVYTKEIFQHNAKLLAIIHSVHYTIIIQIQLQTTPGYKPIPIILPRVVKTNTESALL